MMFTSVARLIAAAGLALAALPAFGGPPSVVQYTTYQTSGTQGESNSSARFNLPTAAGNSLWVVVTISDYSGAHTLSVTDTQGNTFTQLDQENDGAPGSQTVAQFYATNIVGDAGTPDTVTLSTGWDNYRGLLITEVAGSGSAPVVGSAGNIQDGLPAGSGNVTSGGIPVAASQAPGLLLAVAMNTSGGSSDTGGSGFGGPAAATGFTPLAQFWNWGVNLATFESATVAAGTAAAAFNAPDTDSYVTVAALFPSAALPAAPVVSLSATPASILSGASSTLTWSAPAATTCSASGGWSGAQAISGSLGVSPTATTVFTLSCSNPSGTSSPASATVTVTAPLPTVKLAASPLSIVAGGSSTLTWSSTAATACTASGGWAGAEATAGTLAVSPPTTTTYDLVCTNAGVSSAVAAVTVTVTPAPVAAVPTITLAATPVTIVAGAASTLSWSSTGATACTASGAWSGNEATSGSLAIAPAATSVYSLTCSNASGSAPLKSVTVTVTPPKATVSLSAAPASIAAGQNSVLTWSSSNASACTASGAWSGSQALTGSRVVAPGATSTYTLACSNAGGSSAPASATVSVIPATAPHLVQYATHQTASSSGEVNSSVQFSNLTKAGDTLWVAATVSDYAGAHAITVTDTQGNVYTRLDQKNDESPGYQSVAHFYAANVVGDASTPDTITVSWSYDDYKGVVIAEIAGTTATPLVGHAAKIQDALAAGVNNVTSGNVAVGSGQLPALIVALSMNTTGGSSDLGGSGFGGPAPGAAFVPTAQFWNWGLNLATLETAVVTSAESAAAVFSAPDTDSYVTVSAVFQ